MAFCGLLFLFFRYHDRVQSFTAKLRILFALLFCTSGHMITGPVVIRICVLSSIRHYSHVCFLFPFLFVFCLVDLRHLCNYFACCNCNRILGEHRVVVCPTRDGV
ncbi:hypothetical protein BDV28DRAFT_45725 [Aspergillus coremiiformis]|uniref:Uncharacterized protein n=1 Tax=Aspergillus coremiiformis TaxID=138285 RepID=A0A5N6ZCT1_9EURO|nr:hypothetical protein BDV28DRAFT_45725 [Aspergillus coremiiformis]